jgi:hypothetical protein
VPLPLLMIRLSRPPAAGATRKWYNLAAVTFALTVIAASPVIVSVALPLVKLVGSFTGGEGGKE